MIKAIVLLLLWTSPILCWQLELGRLELVGQWLTQYDSNISNLSEAEIIEFKNSYQFAEDLKLTTYDDWINGGIFKIRLKRRPISSTLTLKQYLYLKNPIKNYTVFSLWFSGKINRETSLSALYSYIPSYHYRSYYDEDSSAYVWCSYAVNRFKIEGRRKIARRYICKLGFRYSIYYYNSAFLEYDSTRPQVVVSLERGGSSASISKSFSSEFGLTYKFELTYGAKFARGYDSEGETRENSNESDISYKELASSLKLAKWIKGVKFIGSISYQHLTYTTEKDDPLHQERVDRKIGWEISVNPPPFYNFNLSVGITGERRYADSPYFEQPDMKDYNKLTTYMTLQLSTMILKSGLF